MVGDGQEVRDATAVGLVNRWVTGSGKINPVWPKVEFFILGRNCLCKGIPKRALVKSPVSSPVIKSCVSVTMGLRQEEAWLNCLKSCFKVRSSHCSAEFLQY